MTIMWLALAACFFCVALLLARLLMRVNALKKDTELIRAAADGDIQGRPAETARLEAEIEELRAGKRQAEFRCAELETANLNLRQVWDDHMAKVRGMKQAFAEIGEAERSQLDIVAKLVTLRQQRENLLVQLSLVTEEDRQESALNGELNALDAQIAHWLEQGRDQSVAGRRKYMEIMHGHADHLGLGHPLDEMIWIKMQTEKACGLALNLIEQLERQMSELEMRKQCYQSSMDRLKQGSRPAGQAASHPGGSELGEIRAEHKTMPSPSDATHRYASSAGSRDSERVSVMESERLRAALRQPALPRDLLMDHDPDEGPASYLSSERMEELLSNLESVSSLPPESPIVIRDERDLVVFCRFLLRRVKLGDGLKARLMGNQHPDCSEVTVGKLSWIAPHYQN